MHKKSLNFWNYRLQ